MTQQRHTKKRNYTMTILTNHIIFDLLNILLNKRRRLLHKFDHMHTFCLRAKGNVHSTS